VKEFLLTWFFVATLLGGGISLVISFMFLTLDIFCWEVARGIIVISFIIALGVFTHAG